MGEHHQSKSYVCVNSATDIFGLGEGYPEATTPQNVEQN